MPLSSDIDIPTCTLHCNHNFNLEEARKIQAETKAQAACHKWHKEQEGRLTASNFGMIVKKKKVTEQFIQATYYPKTFTAKATSYGTANEPSSSTKRSILIGMHMMLA